MLFLKKSFHNSPEIKNNDHTYFEVQYRNKQLPCISVIIPARNEEKYIKKCISSLLFQDYNNYEIIVVDDSSSDKTFQIANSFNDKRVKIIKAGEKPDSWIGKNWPCFMGYQSSRGDYLLFTDADTIHSTNSLSMSLRTLLMERLDVLTVVPNLVYPTLIIKMVLPVLSIFMFSRYSPMRVNDPKIKLGYLFGSFFIISRKIYEDLGTHESVRSEIVEDGALGQKIKDMGYKLKMFRGEKLLHAYWARDFHTLWNSLKRLIIPLYFKDKKNSILMTIGIFLLMLFPFIAFGYSIVLHSLILSSSQYDFEMLNIFLIAFSLLSMISIFITNYYQLKKSRTHSRLYCLGTIVGCFVISISFIWSLISSENKGTIKWRDRTYNYNKNIDR